MAISTLSMPAEILDNAVLAWGLAACGLAQLSKLFLELVAQRVLIGHPLTAEAHRAVNHWNKPIRSQVSMLTV